MTTRKIYTVAKDALIAYAESIEASANDNLQALILLGKSDQYGEEMKQARALRSAASYKNMSVRREILRENGFEFCKA